MKKTTKFSPEARERAVRMVFEQRDQHGSEWAAIESIAAKIGVQRADAVELGAPVRAGHRPA